MEKEIQVFISADLRNKPAIYEDLRKAGLTHCVIDYWKPNKVIVAAGGYIGSNVSLKGKNFISRGAYLNESSLGYASYLGENTHIHNTKIGHFCSIGPNVRIVIGQHPAKTFVSTHPAFYSPETCSGVSFTKETLFEEYRYADDKHSVIIGNDCWIGNGAMIMEGVKIADGTIVAAGAAVTKDTMPYSIVGGVPAKTIKYRFAESEIEFLLKLRWWHKGKRWLKQYAQYFYDIDMLRKKVDIQIEYGDDRLYEIK